MTSIFNKTGNKHQTDWLLVLLFLLLVIAGYLAIYSAKFSSEIPSMFTDFGGFIVTSPGKQLVWVGFSLFVGFIIQLIDRKSFIYLAPVIYGIVTVLLVYVMVKGHTVGGGSSWIDLGFMRLQPSEFAKFSTALMVAWYLSGLKANIKTWKGKIITGIILIIPFILIVLQNDTGTALVFSSFIFVLYREGLANAYLIAIGLAIVLALLSLYLEAFWIIILIISLVALVIAILNFSPSWKESVMVIGLGTGLILTSIYLPTPVFLGVLVGLILLCLIAFWWTKYSFFILALLLFIATTYAQAVGYGYKALQPHQKNRIDVFLGKITDRQGVGYNQHQSMMAIGSGGETGKGYLNGNLTKGKFVPEQSTDFIFCTVGEEFGFLGTATIVLLFLFLMMRIIIIGERQPTKFTRIYAYSVASIIFIHFWINIGMTIGLMPVIGIPLPGMSYGGSSLLGFTLLITILVRLDADRGNYTR